MEEKRIIDFINTMKYYIEKLEDNLSTYKEPKKEVLYTNAIGEEFTEDDFDNEIWYFDYETATINQYTPTNKSGFYPDEYTSEVFKTKESLTQHIKDSI